MTKIFPQLQTCGEMLRSHTISRPKVSLFCHAFLLMFMDFMQGLMSVSMDSLWAMPFSIGPLIY
jgi:hypothetical protein